MCARQVLFSLRRVVSGYSYDMKSYSKYLMAGIREKSVTATFIVNAMRHTQKGRRSWFVASHDHNQRRSFLCPCYDCAMQTGHPGVYLFVFPFTSPHKMFHQIVYISISDLHFTSSSFFNALKAILIFIALYSTFFNFITLPITKL